MIASVLDAPDTDVRTLSQPENLYINRQISREKPARSGNVSMSPQWSRAYRVTKRLGDIVVSLCALVALSWLYALTAIAIKLDDHGPVFFLQKRVGANGREFTMFKFRSMHVDAEERLAELAKHNEKDGPVFKMKNDPRITRIGKFIRKTSIDELPQFLNVLRGDMSIVGPRPALPREVEKYDSRQRQRISVKPGLTCYWQTAPARDNISFNEWINMDLRYIRDASLFTDIKLIFRTVKVVLTGQGE